MYKLTYFENQIERLEDGAIIPFDPANRDYQEYIIWVNDGNTPEPYVPPELPPVRILTPLEFMNRFTYDEELAIETAAETSPQLRVWLRRSSAANEIDLDHHLTINGLSALVSAGLITEQRKAEILS